MMNKYHKFNKKIVHIFMPGVFVFSMLFVSFSFNPTNSSVSILKAESKVNIGKKKLDMYEGQTVKLRNKKYLWKSSNKKVATVNKKGKIKAKKSGTAKITATKRIGKKTKKAVCKVYVGKYAKDIDVTSAQTVILKKGQTSIVKANITPDKVLYKDLTYKSENENIVTVSKEGVITPVAAGNTRVIITSKAVNKKKNKIVKHITVVVLEDSVFPTPTPTGEDNKPNDDLFGDIGDGGFVVVTPTPKPTVTPPKSTTEPVITDKPDITEKPTITPEAGSTPTPAPEKTSEPTKTPEPTVEPTPAPTTIAEYIATLTPDPNHPLVGSFVVTNAEGSVRTIYLLNKDYVGNMKLQIDTYMYGSESSVNSILKELENERMSVKNSAGTIHVYRKKLEDPWRVCFLQENITYMFSAKQQDTIWGSNYGIIISEGDTLDNIKILIN